MSHRPSSTQYLETGLPEGFLNEYDHERDPLWVDLLIENQLVPTYWPWYDIGYIAKCCKEGGMFAIRYQPNSITHVRISMFRDGTPTNAMLYEFYLDQRDLRALARDLQIRNGYLDYH